MTRILILVEDDDSKAKAVTRYATRMGYDVHRATNRHDALVLIALHADSNPIVVTDWCFPKWARESAVDGMGIDIVARCRIEHLSVRVFSGRDVPEKGYEDIWFDSLSANGLQAWLEEEAKRT